MILQLNDQLRTVWQDFTLADQERFETEIPINSLEISEEAKLVALNFAKYVGYDGYGYGEGYVVRGVTEQESYNVWISEFNQQQKLFKRQLSTYNLTELPQSVYDGLMLYFWAVNKIHFVYSNEGIYDMKEQISNKLWDDVASTIMRSNFNKQHCIKAATVLRLADYGKQKPRRWFRTQGIFAMRNNNETRTLSTEELKRARFAYYAETKTFLPYTPESSKKQIVNDYKKTMLENRYVFDSSTVIFKLPTAPVMEPIEKLEVRINGDIVQNEFDFTVNGTNLIVTKPMQPQDIITTIIRI